MDIYDLVIIDSGVQANHPALEKISFHVLQFNFISDNEYILEDEISDNIGHGTAVFYLISKYLQDERVLNIKVFTTDFEPSAQQIIEVLQYIEKNISCKIIHLSNGIIHCDEKEQLHDVCRSLTRSGIIIICAFENTGIISYPAAFDEVIGVDWSLGCRKVNEFEYVENSCVNIRGIGTDQRVPWVNSEYNYVSGSSFVSPHVTGEILKQHRLHDLPISKDHILSHFKNNAKRVYLSRDTRPPMQSISINKAIVCPVNKEIHSLIRFNHLLNFDITQYYDIAVLGNVGKKLTDIVSGDIAKKNNKILNYDKLDWNADFDTVILGHTKDISSIIGRNIIQEILNGCIKYNKNIYCFDDLTSYKKEIEQLHKNACKVYYPIINEENVPENRFCKLYSIGKPLLMIMGTSSTQGKFTLQLTLREMFLSNGYSVGQLGTEPSSLLFGMDEVYPMGFGSTVKLQSTDAITVMNQLLNNIEEKNPDIILLGGQSHTLQLNAGNTAFYPLMNYELLLASDPDAIILCVNAHDSFEYIARCISFLESFIDTKVIALVLFPLRKNYRWSVLGVNKDIIDQRELDKYAIRLAEHFKIPCLKLNDKNDINLLFNHCIEYFV